MNNSGLTFESQKYIYTAIKALSYFSKLSIEEESFIDYSVVVSPLMRALELELKRRLFLPYVKYVSDKFVDVSDFSNYNNITMQYHLKKYRSFIIDNSFKECDKCEFTLGCLKYIYGLDVNYAQNSSEEIRIDRSSKEYLEENLCIQLSVEKWYYQLSLDVKEVRDLRNRSSHGGTVLIKEDAEWAVDMLLKTKKILINLLNSWKW